MYGAMAAVHSGQWQHLGDLAKAAEDAGWEYIFSPEGPAADSTDSLAASLVFANATSRIKVGTSIAIIYYRHPYLTASAASNIQEVSGGRLILGLGASHRALHEPMGIEMKSPVTEMRQYVADVRRHAADRLQFPIWLAATRRPMARLAGQIADGVNIFGVPHSLLAETVETVKESSSKAGRSRQEPIMAYAQIGVADDLNIARRAARETLRFYCVFPAYQDLYTTAGYGEEIQAFLAARQRGDEEAALLALSDRLIDDTHVLGPAARCREQMEQMRDSGVEVILLNPLPVGGSDLPTRFRPLLDNFGSGA